MDGSTPRWRDIVTLAQRAEELGFDSVWVADHLLVRDEQGVSGPWEAFSVLAALAASTSRVELGPLVACGSFRNPALLAKMADTLDEISGGRFVLGLGAGWHAPEYRAFGYPFEQRVSRFEEALQIIHSLLKHGQIDFEGKYYSARECELRPRGPRSQGPPILLGTTGARMLRLTARYADQWNGFYSRTGNAPGGLQPFNAALDAACAEFGRDPATLERTASAFVQSAPFTPSRQWGVAPLSGSPEDLAQALLGYVAEGVTHLQLGLEPLSLRGVDAFAPVLELLDRA
jgi:alkanesulfonate monooxygenase SsuD/methylene tetrahydromethanopterin reductase-like flavin-dependent oxidoreductase (luciferase family)